MQYTIRTVTNDITAQDIGVFQPHEHIFAHPTPLSKLNPVLCMDDPSASLQELRHFRAVGGSAMVDAQPGGAGRDASQLVELSQQSGVHIVASTGYHLSGFYHAHDPLYTLPQDALCALFCSEISHGMVAHGHQPEQPRLAARAGIVKAAIGKQGVDEMYKPWLAAAAKAAAQAKTALLLHTEYGEGALEAIALCEKQGLPPHRVIVCHVDRQVENYAPHLAILQTGAYLDYDTIGRFKYHDDASECEAIAHMLDAGYQSQLLLSLDTTRARLRSYGGQIGLCYLIQTFLPLLRQTCSEQACDALTRKNPLKAICLEPAWD